MAIRSNLLMTALVPLLVLLLTVLRQVSIPILGKASVKGRFSPIIAGPIPETNLRAVNAPAVPVIAARYYKHSYPNGTTTAPPAPSGTA